MSTLKSTFSLAVAFRSEREMDPIVLYSANLVLKRKDRKRRRWNVHPINSSRYEDGAYRNLYVQLREDSEKFFNYFRMSVKSFDELSFKVGHAISANPDVMEGLRFSKEEMLCVTLRYLGSGCYLTDLHYSYRMGITTIAKIVKQMCKLLWIALATEVFPAFTEEYWRQAAEGFKKHAYFPHCIGAVDGKHVRLIKPEHSGSLMYNYKHYFSVVILAVVDSNYRFTYVDVGSFGKDADPTIFRCSNFGKAFNEGRLNIPKPEKLTPATRVLPYVLVGDEAFEMTCNLMRPFPGNRLTRNERIFNYRLSTARRFVECAFGILSNKWRIFHRAINLKLPTAITAIKAACVLHNFVRERDGFQFKDTLEVVGLYNIEEEQQSRATRSNKTAYVYRQEFANYFTSPEGAVPWQDSKV